MVFLFHKKNILKKPIQFFFVVTITFPLSSNSLDIKHGKTEVFHLSRLYGPFNSSLLNLSHIKGSILYPKKFWQYLEFVFDIKLSFWYHIKYYANKALLTIKEMKKLVNSTCGLLFYPKWLLYRMCVLPITLYSFIL